MTPAVYETAEVTASDTTSSADAEASDVSSAPASLNVVTIVPPTQGVNGAFTYTIQWQLSSPSPTGGYVVQEVTGYIEQTLQNGDKQADSAHYWEAWPVAPNSNTVTVDENGNQIGDHIGLASQPGVSGVLTWSTSARFYEGLTLNDLPGFTLNNPNTYAHSLLSSTKNPMLSTMNATPPVNRHYTDKW